MSSESRHEPGSFTTGNESRSTRKRVLEVRDLVTRYPHRGGLLGRTRGWVRAVDGVSLDIHEGETLGLVGESGCGKSTLARSILRLVEPRSGTVRVLGEDFLSLRGAALRRARRSIQIVFQDPVSSLNPRMTLGAIVGEGLVVHRIGDRAGRERRVAETLELVGLPASWASRYPHELSGGQRQRVGIARAIILRPELVVCDEAVSALDVSIRAQILGLLESLRRELGVAYLFIAHDLSVVRHLSDRVAVMYLGKIVECARTEDLFTRPLHPYTRALLTAAPVPDPERRRERIPLDGDPPSPVDPPAGCAFHPRCPLAIPGRCDREPPSLLETPSRISPSASHAFACHVTADEIAST